VTLSFVTRVGEEGQWPDPPAHWSFSTLTEAESCPLRYTLRHASYTGAGYGGSGYPDKMTEAALAGTVIHAAVEQVLMALRSISDVSDPAAAMIALRQVGGYTQVIDRCVRVVEQTLSSNPRMKDRVARLGANLRRRTPEIRGVVQGLIARLPPSSVSERPQLEPRPSGDAGFGRGPLAVGRHPEVRLRADAERFKGQIDLLTVGEEAADIIDFKSGQYDEHHIEQILLYGLLWLLDSAANPRSLPVGTMTLAYVDGDTAVPHPSTWSEVEIELRRRIAAADESISGAAVAQLSDGCAMCPVRHMCEAYWHSDYPTIGVGSFVDVEAEIIARNGSMSWTARLTRTAERALIRTTSEEMVLSELSTVRLLDVACERQTADDGASEFVVLTAVASSEIFEVCAS
jgi:hypothetical protein